MKTWDISDTLQAQHHDSGVLIIVDTEDDSQVWLDQAEAKKLSGVLLAYLRRVKAGEAAAR